MEGGDRMCIVLDLGCMNTSYISLRRQKIVPRQITADIPPLWHRGSVGNYVMRLRDQIALTTYSPSSLREDSFVSDSKYSTFIP